MKLGLSGCGASGLGDCSSGSSTLVVGGAREILINFHKENIQLCRCRRGCVD